MTPFDLAQRFVGIREISEQGKDHPLIQWWLMLCSMGDNAADETPWCSAFANGVAWILRLPRSKSAMARSWLLVGRPIPLGEAEPGFDVVILTRGDGVQPGPDVTDAPGHVGFFAGREGDEHVLILGGNQGDEVSIRRFPVSRLLGVRRLSAPVQP